MRGPLASSRRPQRPPSLTKGQAQLPSKCGMHSSLTFLGQKGGICDAIKHFAINAAENLDGGTANRLTQHEQGPPSSPDRPPLFQESRGLAQTTAGPAGPCEQALTGLSPHLG